MPSKDLTLPNIEDVAPPRRRFHGHGLARAEQAELGARSPARRVVEAVARLGYVPHAGARALKLQRSGTVGAVFPTVDNAIFAKAIDALQQRLAEAGLQLLDRHQRLRPAAPKRARP